MERGGRGEWTEAGGCGRALKRACEECSFRTNRVGFFIAAYTQQHRPFRLVFVCCKYTYDRAKAHSFSCAAPSITLVCCVGNVALGATKWDDKLIHNRQTKRLTSLLTLFLGGRRRRKTGEKINQKHKGRKSNHHVHQQVSPASHPSFLSPPPPPPPTGTHGRAMKPPSYLLKRASSSLLFFYSQGLRSSFRMSSSSASTHPPSLHVAVIGAGIAGLTCAQTLLSSSSSSPIQISLFEKSTTHGRTATRDVPSIGSFDHGAPHFAASSPLFQTQVESWVKEGLVFPSSEQEQEQPHYVAHPSMRSLPTHLAKGLTIHRPLLITRLEKTQGGEKWALYTAEGPVQGLYDAVVVAVPAEQSRELLASSPLSSPLALPLAQVKSVPCLSLMAAWMPPLESRVRGWVKEEGVLASARRDDLKTPGRAKGERWVVHATAEYSAEHIQTEPFPKDLVVGQMLRAFGDRVGGGGGELPTPAYVAVQRWLYAQTFSPASPAFGWEEKERVGACGDGWCGGEGEKEGIERAWVSGRRLGEAMLRSLGRG